MAHPQSTPRGSIAKARIDIGSQTMTYNSTAVIFSGRVAFSNQPTLTIYANSTGIRIGTKYISCNSTGNNNT